MRGKHYLTVLVLLFAMCYWFSSSAVAVSITVDGNLTNDWGVKPSLKYWIPGEDSVNTGSVGHPLTGSSNGIYYWIEDAVGSYGYVEPAYGGEKYDVEALYFTYDSNYIYGAVVTGFPVGGTSSFDAGDLAIDLGADGLYEYGVAVRDHDGFSEGKLYKVSEWDDVAYPSNGGSNPFALKSGELVNANANELEFVFSDSVYTEKSVIEVKIAKSLFEGIDWSIPLDIAMHWTMGCGNDAGTVQGTDPVPEPGTILLVGTGLLGLAMSSGRKRWNRG